MQSSKKLFIFDLDGVLTSTSNEHLQAWKELCNQINVEVSGDIEELTKGVSRIDSLNVILNLSNTKTNYTEQEKIELANIKNEIYKEMISKYTEKNVYPGVLKLLQYLKERNVLIALGSASMNGPMLIEKLNIKQYFDYVVNPKPLKSKPNPDIFLDAMTHFKLTPDQCVGIEDATAGIKAINSAKMFSIGIGDKKVLSEADIVFDTVSGIDYTLIDDLLRGV